MKNNTIEHIKNAMPLPWAYLQYILNIIQSASIDNNIKNKWYILSAFFMSITFSGFLSSVILDLKFDFSYSIDKIELVMTFIYTSVPLAVIYTVLMYFLVVKFNTGKKSIFNFFLQVIKFFTIANVILAIIMLISIDQLITYEINMYKDPINGDSTQNIIVIVLSGILYLWILFYLLYKPTYRYLSKFYTGHKVLAVLVIVSTVFLNNSLYNLDYYPKNNPKDLVLANKFCDDILNVKLFDNKKYYNLNIKELNNIKEKCVGLISG